MTKELFIFDMDGTILNTIDDIANAVNYMLRTCNFEERTVEEVKFFVGNGLMQTLRLSLPSDAPSNMVDIMLPDFVEYYKKHSNICTKPYEGIVETIHKLREMGLKIAVVSNKRDEAVKDLCKVYFDGCFDIALGEQEGISRKPAPDMVNMVINHYNIPKDKVVYIGDSDVDLMTAKNSEIDCVAVSWGFRTRDFLLKHGAKTIIDTPQELLSINFNKISQ